jgi:hypothetical protein
MALVNNSESPKRIQLLKSKMKLRVHNPHFFKNGAFYASVVAFITEVANNGIPQKI